MKSSRVNEHSLPASMCLRRTAGGTSLISLSYSLATCSLISRSSWRR